MFTDQITPAMRAVPQKKFAIMGVLTTLNGLFMLFSNAHVSGLMQALLGPTIITIPLSMIFSYLLLKRTYAVGQLLATVIIIAGVMVVIVPSVMGGSGKEHDTAGWALCYLFGSVPLVLCNVYEEKAFDETPIHISYMLGMLVLWQFVSIIACAPFDMIQGFGATTPENFFQHQLDGLECFFNTGNAPSSCEGAWLPITLFVIAYVSTNFTMLGVIKNGSAVFAFICVTLVTPITEFAFAIPALMGDDVEKLYWYHYVSLAILLVGVAMYRFFEIQKSKDGQSDSETVIAASAPAYFSMPTHTIRGERATHRRRQRASDPHWTM